MEKKKKFFAGECTAEFKYRKDGSMLITCITRELTDKFLKKKKKVCADFLKLIDNIFNMISLKPDLWK